MTRLTLKNVLGKKGDALKIIQSLLENLEAEVFIVDENDSLLMGKASTNTVFQEPLMVNDEMIGWVKGDDKAVIVSRLLNLLVQKEYEKKKLGSEVLNLYQEVNMIFDFSDQLAQAIGPAAISAITLREAVRVLQSENGVIVLWDEQSGKLKVEAVIGEMFFDEEKINTQLRVLLELIISGQSEILGEGSPIFDKGIILPHIRSIVYSALKVNHRIMGAIILASSDQERYSAADLKLLTTLALQSSSALESALLYKKNIEEAQEREEEMRSVMEITGKFVPVEFIRSLGHEVITDTCLGEQVEKVVTVLFSDIRDYTTLSEQMTPEENFNFVCSFSEHMGPLIRKYNGFIHQYLGDGIMAIFPNNAMDALNAAIGMQKMVQEINKARGEADQPLIHIGIGLHTGPLIMGIIGDQERMEAAIISDTVNTASRIESLTKHYKADILISHITLQHIFHPKNFCLRHLGLVQLKGKQVSLGIHECFDGNEESVLKNKINTLHVFQEGMQHYMKKSFAKAISAFQAVVDEDPGDLTAKFFLNKAASYISTGVPENWTGVEEMMNK